MTQCALTLDDDHIRTLFLIRLDDGRLQLTGAELRWNGIERDTVAGPLHQAGLASPDHDGFQAVIV